MAATQFASEARDPKIVLRKYLFGLAQRHTTASGMRQAIGACRLLEELDICPTFVPSNAWRLVRGKERLAGAGRWQRWGSLEVLEVMGHRAQSPHERLVTALAVLSTAYCLRIGEAASIRAVDLLQSKSSIRFFDLKSKRQWVTRPPGSYIDRLSGFLRLQVSIQGRSPYLPIVAGGTWALSATMSRLLEGTEFHGITWHAWRRAGATMFMRAGGTMPELLQWGRWKSLRVARKYVARWDGVPWARGKVPWPVVIPGSVGDWRYEWREFKANNLWPPRQFIRDTDLQWCTDDSGAEDVDDQSGAPDVQFDVGVPAQGVKRAARSTEPDLPDPKKRPGAIASAAGSPPSRPEVQGHPTGDQMAQELAASAGRRTPRKLPARQKRPATTNISKDTARLASLANKARRTAQASGAGVR